MSTRRAMILAVAEIGMMLPLGIAQTTPSASFDAASLKRWNMERVAGGVNISGARLEAGAVTLRELIAEAFGVVDASITGTSGWMESERYNIQATAGRAATRAEFRTMLQNLLADRFQLRVRTDHKLIKAYALVVDKGGPKLVPSDQPFHPPPSPPGQTIVEYGSTMQTLLRLLNNAGGQRLIGRPVIDRTGLTGEYHIALMSDFEPLPEGVGFRLNPDYFTALKRDLGLRLDPIEEMFDQITVISAVKPTFE